MSDIATFHDIERTLHPSLLKAERLLIQRRFKVNKPHKIFKLLKQVFKESQDPESCWRIAACYFKGYSVQCDSLKSQFYAKIADKSGLGEGTFFIGSSFCYYQKGYLYFYQSALKQVSAGQFYEAFFEYEFYSTNNNLKKALKKFNSLFIYGDSYWTFVHACNVFHGNFGFTIRLSFAKELYRTCRNQPLSHLTIFQPLSWDFSDYSF
jgi:hypothetical protein